MIRFIAALILVLAGCEPEYSCENCIEKPPADTVIIPPADTIYNDLVTSCSIYIARDRDVRFIYPQVRTKLHPGHYWIFDSIRMGTGTDSVYQATYDLKNYLDMSRFFKGDYFDVRYEVRYRYRPSQHYDSITLIY